MKLPTALAATLFVAAAAAQANEAVIRKTLAERFPNFPKIDEVSKTPVPGLFEIRIGNDVMYTDETGQYIVQGQIIDTRTKVNLTEERLDKLSAIDVASLPLKDAFVIKQGTGARKLVVFSDPNCGYCKRVERDLMALKDVTIYTFLYPILGPDSTTKSRDIWCAKEQGKVWRAWMLDGQAPVKAMGKCDTTAIERNVELGRKHRVQGTPALVFSDGSRAPGAIPGEQIEARLQAAAKKG